MQSLFNLTLGVALKNIPKHKTWNECFLWISEHHPHVAPIFVDKPICQSCRYCKPLINIRCCSDCLRNGVLFGCIKDLPENEIPVHPVNLLCIDNQTKTVNFNIKLERRCKESTIWSLSMSSMFVFNGMTFISPLHRDMKSETIMVEVKVTIKKDGSVFLKPCSSYHLFVTKNGNCSCSNSNSPFPYKLKLLDMDGCLNFLVRGVLFNEEDFLEKFDIFAMMFFINHIHTIGYSVNDSVTKKIGIWKHYIKRASNKGLTGTKRKRDVFENLSKQDQSQRKKGGEEEEEEDEIVIVSHKKPCLYIICE